MQNVLADLALETEAATSWPSDSRELSTARRGDAQSEGSFV